MVTGVNYLEKKGNQEKKVCIEKERWKENTGS